MIAPDLDVIPCRQALDAEPDHGAHDRNLATVCPGTYLHEADLPDRAAVYDAVGRIAALCGVAWCTMANSVAAASVAQEARL